MVLVRYANENLDSVQIDQSVIQGKWNVVFKASGPVAEVLEFKDGTLNDYRDGATTPSASSEYTWNEGVVFAAKWNKSFECHYISDTIIIFVETDTGYIWELEKIA